ncbi:MAG: hypothetical protein ACW98F_04585 [Candidatus Hodarchaeales archaeon]|jgi:hypothetical protein
MAQRKDQSIKNGVFHPSYDKLVIFKCEVENTTGFLRDITLSTVIVGLFSFLLLDWYALLIVPMSWPFLIQYSLPNHYQSLQFNKHSLFFSKASLKNLIRKRSLYPKNKYQYGEIYHIRFNKWEKRKRGGVKDTFGKIEIKANQQSPIFYFLISTEDLVKIIKIFDTYRFNSKVVRKRSRGELMIIFPSSPRYNP